MSKRKTIEGGRVLAPGRPVITTAIHRLAQQVSGSLNRADTDLLLLLFHVFSFPRSE